MSVTLKGCRVSILVKALPRPSSRYAETVCCAGITSYGEFRRLYPVRFRHLRDGASFKRWDWVDFKYREPTSDRRPESCHVAEETIKVVGALKQSERANFLSNVISGSGQELAALGRSLGIIKPRNTRFFLKQKTPTKIEEERQAYQKAGLQNSLLDKELASLEPTPYEFIFKFEDEAGKHEYQNADWEAHAMFFNGRRRLGSDKAVVRWMEETFNEKYPAKGMLFAIGNVARRPQTWQLLGVLRVDDTPQQSLF